VSVGADDRALIARAAQGDAQAFAELVRRHQGWVRRLAFRYTRQGQDAEELAQEIFVRVYKTKAYQPDASFKTWLYKVATNVCLNEVRRPEHRQAFQSIDVDREDGGAPELAAREDGSPEVQLSGAQVAARLEHVLAELPEKQRAAFLMVRHESMSHEEIAVALSTSVSAVKSLVHRALEALRKELRTLSSEGSHPRLGEEAR